MPLANNLLSLVEAQSFLENTLQLQLPMIRLKEDRVGFLRDVITSFHSRIPFQSVTAIATPRPERRRLTFAEIKEDMMTRHGGLCCEMNYFTKVLLETLGFEVDHVSFTALGSLNSHLSTVARNVSQQGDLYLVDVSTGFPIFSPIPLDFEKESPLYKNSFLYHKFFKDPDGKLRWTHKIFRDYYDGRPADVVNEWYTFMVSDLEARDIEFFYPSMENIHTVEGGPQALTPLLVSLRAVDFRNGRLFAIKDTTILEEDASGMVTKKRLSSHQELLEAYKVHFPQFPVETVQLALQTVTLNFSKV